jgi:hypothetical protein
MIRERNLWSGLHDLLLSLFIINKQELPLKFKHLDSKKFDRGRVLIDYSIEKDKQKSKEKEKTTNCWAYDYTTTTSTYRSNISD